MGRGIKIGVSALCALVLLAGAGWAWDSSQRDRIAKGVSVAGVDLGGLDQSAAEQRLRSEIGPRLERGIKVTAGGQVFALASAQAGARVDYSSAVRDALERSRRDWFGVRLWHLVSGDPVSASIRPSVRISGSGVGDFVHEVAAKVNKAPVEPHLSFGSDSVAVEPGRAGSMVDTVTLAGRIRHALTAQGPGPAVVTAPLVPIQPKAGKDPASAYPTAIILNRSNFTLKLFKNLKLSKTYTVAVGMAGLETPSGLYSIQDKQVNPSWHVPNSPWAGKLAGKVIPPGPDDPIKARWMGLASGVGIHGTAADSSLGSAASHGCVRMNVGDVIDLYDRVTVGTPVYII